MFEDEEDFAKQLQAKYFIDRKGEYFRSVLDYLSNPDHQHPHHNREKTQQILKRAIFFEKKAASLL